MTSRSADNGSQAPDAPPGPALAVVMKGYPRLSETFIAQELLSLQRRGMPFTIYSLRAPTDGRVHPVHRAITAPVRYLPEYLYQAPGRVLRAWWRVRRGAGYASARRQWLADLRRDLTPNRGRRFGQALVLAAELPAQTRHIYVHFLHTPASVARYAAMIRGLSWSTSAHAKDIYTIPAWEKAEKLAAMQWLVTCTAANVDHLKALAGGDAGKVDLVYHGLDLERFGAHARAASACDGSDPSAPVELLSVGRAVEKKGYDVLLEALARLPAGLAWRLTHIGGGDLRVKLQQRAMALGIAGRIVWQGTRTQDEVLAAYRAADLFVLASRIADDGDRDGLPNVLMEAQSQGLACLSTDVSGVPELIRDGETGVLVPPGDVEALAVALEALIRDPARRDVLGQAGAVRVRSDFSHDVAVDRLADRLRRSIGEVEAEASGMKVAFYAPLKSPDSPVPSGDRLIARMLLRALEDGGHEVLVVSRLRTYDGAGDAVRQDRLARIAQWRAKRIERDFADGWRPDLWLTYHLYHKAPDWIGPPLARRLGIPYCVVEASSSPRQATGAWATGHAAVAAALAEAALVVNINPKDEAGVRSLVGPRTRMVTMAPFIDGTLFRAARVRRDAHRAWAASAFGLDPRAPWLIAVGMLRAGDKARSYELLACAASMLERSNWCLIVVGDGPERARIEARFVSVAGRVQFVGAQPAERVAQLMAASDVLVWPAINEAIGMVFIEAAMAGLPVVGADRPGIAAVVLDGRTGLLVPEGDVAAFAGAVDRLLGDALLRRTMGAAACLNAQTTNDLVSAGKVFRRHLEETLS